MSTPTEAEDFRFEITRNPEPDDALLSPMEAIERTSQMQRKTRLGKVVGSYRPPLSEWVYWPEYNWTTNEAGWITVAPSGARWKWFATEAEAREYVTEQNEDWTR